MSDKTIKVKSRVLSEHWRSEVVGIVKGMLADYNNPEMEVTIDLQFGNSIDGGHEDKIVVTRKKKTMWVSVSGGVHLDCSEEGGEE